MTALQRTPVHPDEPDAPSRSRNCQLKCNVPIRIVEVCAAVKGESGLSNALNFQRDREPDVSRLSIRTGPRNRNPYRFLDLDKATHRQAIPQTLKSRDSALKNPKPLVTLTRHLLQRDNPRKMAPLPPPATPASARRRARGT